MGHERPDLRRVFILTVRVPHFLNDPPHIIGLYRVLVARCHMTVETPAREERPQPTNACPILKMPYTPSSHQNNLFPSG